MGDEVAPDAWNRAAALIETVRTSGRADYTDTALCAPVHAGDKVLGVIVLGRALGGRSFTASDEKLLLGLSGQAGVALERARLHEREASRMQLEQELAVARRIQLTLLPSAPPVVPGWGFAASYQAAREVGGDFYDFMEQSLADGQLGIVIADVTGKGIPAALMMAHSRAVLRAESMSCAEPVTVLSNSNRLFLQDRQAPLFLSAFCAQIELKTGRLTFANAGHDAPLLVTPGGAVRELEAPGVVLGAFHDTGLESRTVTLDSGDTVVMFTDGVTEARDPLRRLFGDERLQRSVASAVIQHGSADAVMDAVLHAVDSFTAGAEQSDDLTIVVVQREGG